MWCYTFVRKANLISYLIPRPNDGAVLACILRPCLLPRITVAALGTKQATVMMHFNHCNS